jgi:hypothetical protein
MGSQISKKLKGRADDCDVDLFLFFRKSNGLARPKVDLVTKMTAAWAQVPYSIFHALIS